MDKIEQNKYNFLHKSKSEYGLKTRRLSWFKKNDNEFVQRIDNILKSSITVCDVGCGKGNFFKYFSKKYPNIKIKGFDLSEKAVSSLKSKNIICASANNTPYKDNEFEVVYHFDGLEHIPTDIEDNVIEEQFRISSKYVIHQIALFKAKEDDFMIKRGFSPVHINLKKYEEWLSYFQKKSDILNFKIIYHGNIGRHFSIILEKKK